MSTQSKQLHILFFPFMAHGHLLPTIDMAKLFASRGCKTTVILTPVNASLFSKSIERGRDLGLHIQIALIKFPTEEVGLPQGCENAHFLTEPDSVRKFFIALGILENSLEKLLIEHTPDCLVAGGFFPWATDVAAKFGIPRIVFHGTNFFSSCASTCMLKYEPHKKVLSESESIIIPNLPHEIKLTMDQVPGHLREESEWLSFWRKLVESEVKSFGVIVNSFYELEPDYADHYRTFLGRKAWHIGPLFLLNKDREDKLRRGPETSIDEHDFVTWLNTKEPNSVVYVSFGSLSNFNDEQLIEIAKGLEASGKPFIWVVKKEKREGEREEWLPEGFEERMKEKGLIIRGWAPQVVILDHEAIGAFVTHCGWNSMLEGICAGLPMVTWPVAEEQFYNEKLVTEIIGIGVGVGTAKWVRFVGDRVKSEAVAKAVNRVMEGDEMRVKAKVVAELARKAFGEGGSSYSDLDSLIEELKMNRDKRFDESGDKN